MYIHLAASAVCSANMEQCTKYGTVKFAKIETYVSDTEDELNILIHYAFI